MTSISLYSPLPELGMDSISGLEIKQTLEQHYDVFLSPKEIMSLTFAQLESIQKSGNKGTSVQMFSLTSNRAFQFLRVKCSNFSAIANAKSETNVPSSFDSICTKNSDDKSKAARS